MKPATMRGILVAVTALALVGIVLRLQPSASSRGTATSGERTSATSPLPVAADAVSAKATASARSGTSYAAALDGGPVRAGPARSADVSTTASAAVSPPVVAPDAARGLADALRNGDDRSPPVVADAPPAERATTAELADPAAYRRYEQRGQARLYRAFEQEAVIALGDIERDIQRARAAGLSAAQIAEGEEKQRVLAETLERLRRGELGGQ